MKFELIQLVFINNAKKAVADILLCNDYIVKLGLTFSHSDAVELIKTRTLALKSSGRIEFGCGVMEKIIKAFCEVSLEMLRPRNLLDDTHSILILRMWI